jgi:hypothetical protein
MKSHQYRQRDWGWLAAACVFLLVMSGAIGPHAPAPTCKRKFTKISCAGPKMEDVLFEWKIIGHYRYFGAKAALAEAAIDTR